MTSQEILLNSLNHKAGKVPVDFGATSITGIHCSIVAGLRKYYGLEDRPVRLIEPYQMLGDIDEELIEAMGVDVIPMARFSTMFGFDLENFKEWKSPWGQLLLVPEKFNVRESDEGYLMFPKGDSSCEACACMPKKGFFFDARNRQGEIDEDNLKLEDNLEEFTDISESDLAHWKADADKVRASNHKMGTIAHMPTTALGDIAFVPAMNLDKPKGVRNVADWYMLLASDEGFVAKLFDAQCEIAIQNLAKIHAAVGGALDVAAICGTDFGTQNGTFCSLEKFMKLWHPRYKKINDWIHENTTWKTFKHSCGAVEGFMNAFIESGFDIINPVQCSAAGMEPQKLKDKYGDRITFWGAGIDTQKVLPYGTPEEVRAQVLKRLEIFSKNGGFVFNAIHNIQAKTPIENVAAMIEAVKEFNS